MTDRSPPTDDDLVLAALAGDVDEASLSPSLRAEVAGLKAMRSLLDDDAAWGQQTGADVPPPHLLDAIVRAEVLARPDVVRNAVAASSSPTTSTPKAWWQKLSSWAVGGGVVVSAAAAVLITVERAPEVSHAAQKADAEAAPSAAAPLSTPTAATPAPTTPPADALAFGSAETGEGKGADGDARNAARFDGALVEPAAELAPAELAKQAPEAKPEAKKAEAPARDEAAAPKGSAPKDGYAVADDDAIGGLGLASRGQGAGGGGLASGPGASSGAAKNSVAPPPPPMPAAAPAPVVAAEPAPVVTPAAEARRVFRERLAEKADKAARAREEASAPAKAKAKKSASLDDEHEAAPRPDFESAQRQRQVQQANDSLVTAENELAHGRFAVALDLAQRAEALAGGALGLAPASTSSRAYFGLKRYADAARVGSRLLQGDVRDPQVVDGLLAGAKGALQVGDHVLARRLLEHALKPANVDVARRTEAQRLLQSARAVPDEAAAATSTKP
ncbi:MAG TPA: hypothetical protein VGF99_09380 [Myxococcota bacterium]